MDVNGKKTGKLQTYQGAGRASWNVIRSDIFNQNLVLKKDKHFGPWMNEWMNEWISRKWQLFVSTWLILNAKVGWITIRGAAYYKSHNNVDLPSTLLLLTKKLVTCMSRSLRPDIFQRPVDRATISKNRYDALQPTQIKRWPTCIDESSRNSHTKSCRMRNEAWPSSWNWGKRYIQVHQNKF